MYNIFLITNDLHVEYLYQLNNISDAEDTCNNFVNVQGYYSTFYTDKKNNVIYQVFKN